MKFIETVVELRQLIQSTKSSGKRVSFVPTMGNLHEGHLQLIDIAKQHGDLVVCSIFVNPTQFGENEDFGSYPRTLDQDKEKLESRDCDLLFYPNISEMYPKGNDKNLLSLVSVPTITENLCGQSRPGHFDGVSTVVSKLFNMVQPDAAIFGEKDFQQLAVIRAFTEDLNFPVEIVGAPIAREPNGLAMSSRNGYLSDDEKQKASFLYQLLCQTKEKITQGERDFPKLQSDAHAALDSLGFKPDYFEIFNSQTLQKATSRDTQIVILLAAFMGNTRLIDNLCFELEA